MLFIFVFNQNKNSGIPSGKQRDGPCAFHVHTDLPPRLLPLAQLWKLLNVLLGVDLPKHGKLPTDSA